MTQTLERPRAPNAANRFMSDRDFSRIAAMAQRDFGLSLPGTKRSLVVSRLGRRLRKLGLMDFTAYVDLLDSPEGDAEREELLSSLTTNVTRFFREAHHFRHLEQEVLPDLARQAAAGQRVRMWSAGCSSGEEIYSLAVLMLARFTGFPGRDTKLLATDIDPAILSRAKAAIYPTDALTDVPRDLQDRLVGERTAETFTVSDELRQMISFGVVNLVADLPMSGPFDVIFCRNVAIYFDQPTQRHVWHDLARLLRPGGYLYIGHSERVSGPATGQLKNVGITAYRKV